MNKLSFDSLINLELTQESGQTSQSPWLCKKVDNYEGIVNNNYYELILLKNLDNLPVLVKISQVDKNFTNFTLDYELSSTYEDNTNFSNKEIVNDLKNEVNYIFNLDFNLEKFYKYIKDDPLSESIDFCNGLRVFLAKDRFECIISSICSANNSISRWTDSISKIKKNWGHSYNFDICGESTLFFTFPKPNEFKDFYSTPLEEYEASNRDYEIDCYKKNLKSCGVGYRAPYMKESSNMLLKDINVDEISNMNYDDAFKTISKLPGVGPKVSDCILLYGFGFMEAFPSDVWIKRIVSYMYFDGEEISAKKTRSFGMDHFGDYAGYAQLYLFHYARKSGLMDKIKNK